MADCCIEELLDSILQEQRLDYKYPVHGEDNFHGSSDSTEIKDLLQQMADQAEAIWGLQSALDQANYSAREHCSRNQQCQSAVAAAEAVQADLRAELLESRQQCETTQRHVGSLHASLCTADADKRQLSIAVQRSKKRETALKFG